MRIRPKFLWELLLYVSVFSGFSCSRSHPEPLSSPSIVGGRVTEAPAYMAGLVDEGGTYAFCGGSFIAPRVVVTAAHCVEDMQKKIRVSAGLSLNSQHARAQLIPVQAVFPHPQYDKVKLLNDLAIVYLAPYDAGSLPRPIVPVVRNTDSHFPDQVPGTKVTVTGWGNTSSFGKLYDDPLRTADLDVIPVTRCSLSPGYDDVNETQICAGDIDHGGIDSCNGDSGGPLVAQKSNGSMELVGVVSWGEGCALAGKPGVYTRISAFNQWIDATVQKLEPRIEPLATEEIKGVLNSYCYDGWAYSRTSEDSSHSLEVATQFRIDGDFRETTPRTTISPLRSASLESNLPLCWAHLGENLTLSGAVIFDTDTSTRSIRAGNAIDDPARPNGGGSSWQKVKIMARQEEPYAAWVAPAKRLSKLSLTCKTQPMSLKSFMPDQPDASFSFGSSAFDILNEESDGLKPDDELHTCSYEGHSITYAVRKDSAGSTKSLLQITSPLFGNHPRTYRLADSSSSKIKVELRFRPISDFTGNLEIKNLTDDDIHTWRLECNVSFGLIDEFGAYYTPLIREGSAVHHFARPSHLFATIKAEQSVRFVYDGRVPLDQSESLRCKINNQRVSIKHDQMGNPI
jgi:secreted trypsin-like serine protease